ncbi:MAG: STY0301 family protein [Pseudomonadota bacterium]
MKKILLVGLLFASTAQAKEISCPKFYPWQDTVLAEVPYQHTGKGVIKKQELSGASWMGGDFNDTFGEMVGGVTKVEGGLDIQVPSFAKWFVCWYGGGAVAWWEELKLTSAKVKSCKIEVRNKVGRDPMDAKLVCK